MAKPRVIVSSDIGGADNDDMQSMAHVLLYADQLDIKALISTPTAHGGRTHHIQKALDAYSKDYAKLATWGDYPNPDSLKSVVYQGNIKVAPSAGYSNSTAASQKIVKEAHAAKAAGDPLWVMTWGALTDVAQALHDDPSIASTIRVLASNGWNWTQDPNAYNYTLNHAKSGMWMIDSKSTHRGIYLDSGGGTNNGFNFGEVKGHGALGDYFYNARPYGVKMGDSWSIAYLVDHQDNNNPGGDSWGGTFVKNGLGPRFWTDDPNSAHKVGSYKGAQHVREHQKEIYNDMYKHFDRAKFAKAGGNTDDPVIANNDSGVTKKDVPLVLKVLMNDKALDGGLKIASADATTAKGGTVVVNNDGTLKYTPKAGFVGDDTFKYTAKDADGDTDIASVALKVQAPTSNPVPTPPPTNGGGDDPVIAKDDVYKLDAGKTLWVNTRYLTWNDTGKDGGLKVTDIADHSEHGVAMSWAANGTLVYHAKPGFVGTDRVEYTVVDKDGDSDTAHLVLNIGKGSVMPPPAVEKPTPPKDGTNHSVTAVDDVYKSAQGKDFFVNAKYLVKNDKGLDGGLKVIALDKMSKHGADVSLSHNGTVTYDPSDWFRGTDSVKYTVVDTDGSMDIGTVVIHVG